MLGGILSLALRVVPFLLDRFKAKSETKKAFYEFVDKALQDQNVSVKISKNVQSQIEELKNGI